MSKYWIFLVWMASLCVATIGCGSQGTAATTPSPTPFPSPTPTPPPPPTPTPAATPVTTAVTSPFNNNSPFLWLSGPGSTTVKLSGSGFASIDTQPIAPSMPLTSRVFVSSTEWDIGLGFDNVHFREGFYTLGDCNSAGCANPPAPFAFLTDGLSRLAMGADGRFCQRDAGTVACFNADGTPLGTPFTLSNGAAGIAFESTRNLIILAASGAGAVAMFDAANPLAPGHFSSANVSGSTKDVATLSGSGLGCVAQPTEGIVTIFPVDLTSSTSVSSPAGTVGSKPWSVAMTQVGAELDCASISSGDSKLVWTNTADGSTKGTLTLTGITPNGMSRIVAWNSGAQAGTLAVFSPQDSLIVFVNSSTKTEIRRVVAPVSPTSHVIQVAVDETAGNLILVYANMNGNAASTSFMKLAVASGAPVPYAGPNSNSNILFMDVAVSPAFPVIRGGSLGQNAAIAIQ
jgi:hypothetical protein